MSDEEESVPSFAEDERVRFIGNKICQFLRIKPETWDNYLALENSQKVLQDFFEKNSKILIFCIQSSGVLTSCEQASSAVNGVYIQKKEDVTLLPVNYREHLSFGVVSLYLLEQLLHAVDQVFVPVLKNKNNHRKWPRVVSQDISQHAESLQRKVSILRGLCSGKTHLPIPTVTTEIESLSYSGFNVQDGHNRTVIYVIESMVINWTHQIRDVLKEDSRTFLQKGSNLGPNAEYEFWKSRKENMQSIYEQLQSPVIQKMVEILEVSESSYLPTLKTTLMDVFYALQEARDIELHLRPLDRLLSQLQEKQFPHMQRLVDPLLHVLCLVWCHCEALRSPPRLVVLLQELCNLFIEQATEYLSPRDLLKVDTEEALEKIQVVVACFTHFKETFQTQREKLASCRGPGQACQPWDFPSALVFVHFDRFLVRLRQLQDLFITMLEFEKLEKLEFGGTGGKGYSEQVTSIYVEFQEHCKAFKNSECSPHCLSTKEFEGHYDDFKEKVLDFECRLATIMCLAFNDCSGLESALKLLAVCGPFLERPVIKEIFSPNFSLVLQLFGQELEKCRQLYVTHLHQMRSGKGFVGKNMPLMSGSLKWAKMLRERLELLWATFTFIQEFSMDDADRKGICQRYSELLALLDQYEGDIYSDWCHGLDQVCHFSLDQNLIRRHKTTGLLSVNFSSKLLAVLRDVKYLLLQEYTKVPSVALAIFKKKGTLIAHIGTLKLLVQAYNSIKQTALEVEVALIGAQLSHVDAQLLRVQTEFTWQHHSCWDYVCALKDAVQNLELRIQKTKENVGIIQTVIKGWSEHPLFCRKDNKKDALLQLEDRAERLAKRYGAIQRDGQLIHKLIDVTVPFTMQLSCY